MKLFNLSEKVTNILPILLFAILVVYTIKPNIIFKPNGKIREFGLFYDNEGYKKTLYNFQFLLIIFIILAYYFM
jgi:hypothetical protein